MDLDDEEYYYNKFIKTHISKKELKEKYISKDKIRELYEKWINDIDCFKGEMLKDITNLLEK